jgi:hypothetical protein
MNDQAPLPLQGGCQCGAVRYRVTARPGWVGHCHCRMCQRAHGAPVVPWLVVAAEGVTFTKGALKRYRSSDKAERGFCGDCGTPLAWIPTPRPDKPPRIDMALSTLDDPTVLSPTVHIWCDSAMPWMPVDDHLPRHPQKMPSATGG